MQCRSASTRKAVMAWASEAFPHHMHNIPLDAPWRCKASTLGLEAKPDGLRVAADFLLIRCHAPRPNKRYLRWSWLWLCVLEEADTGWDRQRRRNGVTSVVTLAGCICQGCWPCVTAGSLCAITGLSDNTSEPLPATAGAHLEQCPLKERRCSSQERLTGVSASDAVPLPYSKQVLRTPRSCIKPSLCTSPAGSLAQSKPYNNKLGCESETKNNSVRKQISGSGCQGVITLNNRQSIISTVLRDVLTVSFQNGKQADRFGIKNTGEERRKDLPRSSTRS